MIAILILALMAGVSQGDERCGSVTQNLTCVWQDLCRAHEAPCKCDDLCNFYNDCCPDYHLKDTVPYKPDGIQCVRNTQISVPKIFIISHCPDSFNDEMVKNSCEEKPNTSKSLLTSLPVSDDKGILFKNPYCAVCHGVREDIMFYWKANIGCFNTDLELSNLTIVKEALKNRICVIKYDPPAEGLKARTCFDVISQCSKATDVCTKHHCEESAFRRPVFKGVIAYKNEHCYLCNEDSLTEDMCAVTYGGGGGLGTFYPLSIIIDLNPNGGNRVGYLEQGVLKNESEVVKCAAGHIYDIILEKCILVTCSSGYERKGDVCVSSKDNVTDCIRSHLTSDQYILFSNGTLLIDLKYTLNESQYEDLGNGTVAFCASLGRMFQSKDSSDRYKFDEAQTIVSMIGQCISIICLVIHLVVYSILPQLRNTPGKSLMALVTSLLLAQLLFLFGVGQTNVHVLCVIVGLLIHYAFLASFFWMSILSVDIWSTFSESDTASNISHFSKKFTLYCLIGFLSPLVIVCISYMVNIAGTNVPDYLRPLYGQGLCWIVHRIALLIFFGIPVFSMVSFNILLYGLTVYNLHKISQITKHVQADPSERRRLFLYIKLSSIMGATWIFGVIAVLADVGFMWYIFLFFNTLQGAFICVTFVLTKKALGLLRDKYRRTWLRHYDTSETDGTRSTELSKKNSVSSSTYNNTHGASQSGRMNRLNSHI